ncbi:protein singed [Pantoea osteomyelitidis]|uniref:Protein singed n=1 Tax=Pantoea osteomyelitidis TaxID=3230026 RepID=A0ABW7PXY6_9GAMM
MITYVTVEDVDRLLGQEWANDSAKSKAVLMANAWMNTFSLRGFSPDDIPENVKLAGAYAASVAAEGKLFQQKTDSGVLTSKSVEADGVAVSKTFTEISAADASLLPADLQLAIALLKPWGASNSQLRVERG